MDKEELNKRLLDILTQFGQICGGVMFGEIPFTFNGDALMCALKPGHPGDIMDDVVSMVYDKVHDDPIESLPTVKEGLESFQAIEKVFGIPGMEEPIKALTAYVKEVESIQSSGPKPPSRRKPGKRKTAAKKPAAKKTQKPSAKKTSTRKPK